MIEQTIYQRQLDFCDRYYAQLLSTYWDAGRFYGFLEVVEHDQPDPEFVTGNIESFSNSINQHVAELSELMLRGRLFVEDSILESAGDAYDVVFSFQQEINVDLASEYLLDVLEGFRRKSTAFADLCRAGISEKQLFALEGIE